MNTNGQYFAYDMWSLGCCYPTKQTSHISKFILSHPVVLIYYTNKYDMTRDI